MVRVLLRAAQPQSHMRPGSTERPSNNQQRQLPHPSRRSGSSDEIAQEGEVSKSGQRPSGAGTGRGRNHDMRPTDYLQQDMADRGVAHAVDPISHHFPKKGNLQLCENYHTINLISHPSKIMVKFAEEQAGFRRSGITGNCAQFKDETNELPGMRYLMMSIFIHVCDSRILTACLHKFS